ncbi:OB-fold-containig protein [Planctomycetes bacterium K23_9]|uniref:Uncharacterized protein n=1 Tax=Stieleria marina TaxID=1930275 RepID=A0A517P0R4_9BACT|nr:hypothetical protein K239x_49670 [Planctomycetes bacterium K23_9]
MSEIVTQFSDNFLVGPIWPASIMLALMIIYSGVAALGVGDFDAGLDVDVDMNVDLDVPDLDVVDVDMGGGGVEGADLNHPGLFGSLGAMTVRWSNFGRIPIAIWGGVFTLALWGISYSLWHGFDVHRYSATLIPSILLTIRNAVIAVLITKPVTQPLVGKFDKEPGYDSSRMLGSTCEISSIEANPSYGQAKFRTNAAPLLLNVRTDGSTFPRGTEVRIIDFNRSKRIYTVTKINSES